MEGDGDGTAARNKGTEGLCGRHTVVVKEGSTRGTMSFIDTQVVERALGIGHARDNQCLGAVGRIDIKCAVAAGAVVAVGAAVVVDGTAAHVDSLRAAHLHVHRTGSDGDRACPVARLGAAVGTHVYVVGLTAREGGESIGAVVRRGQHVDHIHRVRVEAGSADSDVEIVAVRAWAAPTDNHAVGNGGAQRLQVDRSRAVALLAQLDIVHIAGPRCTGGTYCYECTITSEVG